MPLSPNNADDIQFDEWTYSALLTRNRFVIELAMPIVSVHISLDFALRR